MKKATLLHNPKAGEESFTREELISKIEAQGIKCVYQSTKADHWKIEEDSDFVIVAGGDGTVKKVTEKLLKKNDHKNFPLALLPAGTANNIARTLDLSMDEDLVISNWKKKNIRKYDVGRVYNVSKANFFLESFGFGVFPALMKQMESRDKDQKDTPEKKLKLATELLHEIMGSYKPRYCELDIDGSDHSGKFFLVEVMNTQSIGPNLILSPHGDPGDGEFEVVLIPESQKEKFLSYLQGKIEGKEELYLFDICKAKSIRIKCDGMEAHVDDKIVKLDQKADVKIELLEGLLSFMV